jgi:tRNA (cytosine40_48-C5)-methyltransferase
MVDIARPPAGPQVRAWATKHGFSEAFAARLVAVSRAAGADTPLFLDGLLRRPPRYLRVNPLRASPEEVRKRLIARGFETSRVDLDEHVLRIGHAPMSPGATQEHLLGMTTLQDLASASAPLALQARPGEVVADLAAAPGVKSLHIAGDMQNLGALVCVERDAARARALRFNLERGGAACAIIRTEDAAQLPEKGWADRVLLDAPCTGEGTLPKDRKRRRMRGEEIAELCAVQERLLDAADRVLRPGGTLVYATCTFGPEENEVQVARLLRRGYSMQRLPFDRCTGVLLGRGITDWPGHELPAELAHARRFFPGIHPSLGFFVAALRKEDA